LVRAGKTGRSPILSLNDVRTMSTVRKLGSRHVGRVDAAGMAVHGRPVTGNGISMAGERACRYGKRIIRAAHDLIAAIHAVLH
jgi:hypothetical protein